MTEKEYQRICSERRRLPGQIENARIRLTHLYRQAVRLGMNDLVPPEHLTSTGE